MWKPEQRQAADRNGLRYPSDLTDAEWAIVEPMFPPAKGGGRRRSVDVREVLNGIFYILWTGCQWKALPKDLPPKSTVHDYLELWNWDGTLERIHHELYVAVREQEGHEASPTVAIIDSQRERDWGRPVCPCPDPHSGIIWNARVGNLARMTDARERTAGCLSVSRAPRCPTGNFTAHGTAFHRPPGPPKQA